MNQLLSLTKIIYFFLKLYKLEKFQKKPLKSNQLTAVTAIPQVGPKIIPTQIRILIPILM